MKALICGGRTFDDEVYAVERLMAFHAECPISQVISGCAKGADTIGELWADLMGIPVRRFPADWKRDGKAAGPIRNERMLRLGKPDAVIAFPGTNGTAHMVRIASEAGVEIVQYKPLYFRKEDPQWGFLSNFYPHDQIDEDGCIWSTNEHFYQSRKTTDEKQRSLIQGCARPNEAKRIGQAVDLRPDWDEIKLDQMMAGLRLKFLPGSALSERLIDSGETWLVELAPWGDTWWGVDKKGDGQNWLGKLLCRRRTELTAV